MKGPLLRLFDFMVGNCGADEVILSFFAVSVILLLVLPVHECAHGLMARILGDDTAKRQGRLTLNPLVHIDPIGAGMMLLFPIGWAKPVEVNYSRCHKVKGKTAMALTAAAGPLANIIMACFFLIICKVLTYTLPQNTPLYAYLPLSLSYIVMISLYLAVLNLLPIPPFDGSKILFAFLHPRTVMRIMQYQQIISIVFLMLLFMTDIFTVIIGTVSNYLLIMLDYMSIYIDFILG